MPPLAKAFLATMTVLLVSAPCRAGDSPEDQVFSRLSEKRLEQILQKEKIPFERKTLNVNGKDVVIHAVTLGQWKGVIVLGGNALEYNVSFKDRNNNDVPIERTNEWNSKKRFSRAYVDPQGYGVLQSDLEMIGGTSERIIRAWLTNCRTSSNDFAQFVR